MNIHDAGNHEEPGDIHDPLRYVPVQGRLDRRDTSGADTDIKVARDAVARIDDVAALQQDVVRLRGRRVRPENEERPEYRAETSRPNHAKINLSKP